MITPNHRPIGVLGGMGPEATILLQTKLLQAVNAHDDSDHIPLLIDMNTQVPSRINHLVKGHGADPGPVLAQMAQRLEVAGAKALAMPCNTAHKYADAITEAVQIPLLNIITLSADYAKTHLPKGGRVGFLASPSARIGQVFDHAFAMQGLEVLWPQDDAPMLAAIRDIKAHGPTEQARETLRHASNELAGRGADMQFIACSEFSLISDATAEGHTPIDTLDLLVTSMLEHARYP